MPFLFALLLISWAHLIAMLRAAAKAKTGLMGLHALTLVLFLAAVADFYYLSPLNRQGVPGDAQNWIPLAVFLYGMLSAAIFGGKSVLMYRARTDNTGSGWRSGISLACVLAGLYVASTAIDHWMFFL